MFCSAETAYGGDLIPNTLDGMSRAAAGGWWKPPRWMHPFGVLLRKVAERVSENRGPEFRLDYMEDSLATVIRKFGPDSGPAARGRASVANQLESMGRLAEARLLREEALAAHRRNVGDDDEQTLVAEGWLAVNLVKSGLREEAKAHFSHVYEVRLRTLGLEHELTQWIGRWLASTDTEGDSGR